MDLTNAISGLQQAKTMAAVQMKVARKILDNQEMQGAAAIKLINAAGNIGNQAGYPRGNFGLNGTSCHETRAGPEACRERDGIRTR
jgi:hypothetical protein